MSSCISMNRLLRKRSSRTFYTYGGVEQISWLIISHRIKALIGEKSGLVAYLSTHHIIIFTHLRRRFLSTTCHTNLPEQRVQEQNISTLLLLVRKSVHLCMCVAVFYPSIGKVKAFS